MGNLVVQRARRAVELLSMPVRARRALPVGNGEDRSDEVESDGGAARRWRDDHVFQVAVNRSELGRGMEDKVGQGQ